MHKCKDYCRYHQKLIGYKKGLYQDFYVEGGKYCSTCDHYYPQYAFSVCECCGNKLRTKPKNKYGKERLRNE